MHYLITVVLVHIIILFGSSLVNKIEIKRMIMLVKSI